MIKKVLKGIILTAVVLTVVGVSWNRLDTTGEEFIGLNEEVINEARSNKAHDDVIRMIEEAVLKSLDNDKIINAIKSELEIASQISDKEDILTKASSSLTDGIIKAIYETDYKIYVPRYELDQIILDADIKAFIYNTLHDKLDNLMAGSNKIERNVKLKDEIDFGVGSDNKEFIDELNEFDSDNTTIYDNNIDKSISLKQSSKLFNDYVKEHYGEGYTFEELPLGGSDINHRRAEVYFLSSNGNTKKVELLEMDLNNGTIKTIKKYYK